MKTDFDQKRAEIEAELTRYDGRLYDISEAEGVLSLQLRRGVAWERSLIIALIVLLGWILMTFLDWRAYRDSRDTSRFLLDVLEQSGQAIFIYGGSFLFLVFGQSWKIDKNSGKICCGSQSVARLSSIYGLEGKKRGAKFDLFLKSRNDKPRRIGVFGFCRSENVWRQDAAQIAAFLSVPLEIPPL